MKRVEEVARKTTVLQAARALMGRHGNAFTISSLCEESGLSRSAVRRVFPTKAKILKALVQETRRNAADACESQPDASPPIDSEFSESLQTFPGEDHSQSLRADPPGTSHLLEAGPEQELSSASALEGDLETASHTFAELPVELEVGPIPDGVDPTCPPALESQLSEPVELPPATEPDNSFAADEAPAAAPSAPGEDGMEAWDAAREGSAEPDVMPAILPASDEFAESPLEFEVSPASPIPDGVDPRWQVEGQLPEPVELPPTIEPIFAADEGSAATPSAPGEDGFGTEDPDLSRKPAVEREVMRSILANARAQAARRIEVQAERRPSETTGRRLTIFGAATVGAVGIIVAVIGSRNMHAAPKPALQRIATHSAVPHTSTPPLLVINATGDDEQVSERPSAAIESLVAKAVRGDAGSQSRLALAYLKGDGVAKDPAAGLGWSQMAAMQGDASAQFILATIYAEGIKPNPAMSALWLAAAASRGNLKAMHNLAIAYLNGAGVPKDMGAALSWLGRAASAGYTDSAFDLAVLYERGEGVPQDLRLALHWYGVAASQGDHEAAQRIELLKQATKIALEK